MEYRKAYPNEMYHHGIKGMKWGIRRYQNEDGTLTPEGEKRYNAYNADRKLRGEKALSEDQFKRQVLDGKRYKFNKELKSRGLKELSKEEFAANQKKVRKVVGGVLAGALGITAVTTLTGVTLGMVGHQNYVNEKKKEYTDAFTKAHQPKENPWSSQAEANARFEERLDQQEEYYKKNRTYAGFEYKPSPDLKWSDFDDEEYIEHHGIKGQKWGVRRFQNEDGSLTPEGEARYAKYLEKRTSKGYDAKSKEDWIKSVKRKKALKTAAGVTAAAVGATAAAAGVAGLAYLGVKNPEKAKAAIRKLNDNPVNRLIQRAKTERIMEKNAIAAAGGKGALKAKRAAEAADKIWKLKDKEAAKAGFEATKLWRDHAGSIKSDAATLSRILPHLSGDDQKRAGEALDVLRKAGKAAQEAPKAATKLQRGAEKVESIFRGLQRTNAYVNTLSDTYGTIKRASQTVKSISGDISKLTGDDDDDDDYYVPSKQYGRQNNQRRNQNGRNQNYQRRR